MVAWKMRSQFLESTAVPRTGSTRAAAALLAAMLAGCATPPATQGRLAPCPSVPANAPWATVVAAAICPLIHLEPSAQWPNRSADFTVTLSPQGTAMEVTKFSGSGSEDWDRAVAVALRTLQPYPSLDGKVPTQAIILVSPTRISVIANPRDSIADRRDARNSYAARISAAVREALTGIDVRDIPGNPGAEFEVDLADDGRVSSVRLTQSSGYPAWDEAAMDGLRKVSKLPLDGYGKSVRSLALTLRPR